MKKNSYWLLLLLWAWGGKASAQDAQWSKLMDSLDTGASVVKGTFHSTRVINAHSVEMLGKGSWDFRILHRFGPVSTGLTDLFGLDQASMRLGADFGVSKHLTLGFGRTTFKKDIDFFLKYRLVQQSNGPSARPFSLVAVLGSSIQTYPNPDPAKPIGFDQRAGYYAQLLVGKKFNQNFSLQLTPSVVFRQKVPVNDANAVFALGLGGRYKISKRVAFVADYAYVFNGFVKEQGANPLSLGIDIETGGHVFQLHFSNAPGMNERALLTETVNTWGSGEIRFGFNLSRIFNLKKRT